MAPRSSRPAGGATLEQRYADRDNALNLVRLFLAAAVVVSHVPGTAGIPAPMPQLETIGAWAVDGFFLISGYLVLGSRLDSNVFGYLLRRVCRVYPGFWVQMLVVALVFAPLTAWLGFGQWSFTAAWDYLRANWLDFDTMAMVGSTPLTHFTVWNAQVWTLLYEILAYLLLAAVFLLPASKRFPAVVSWLLFLAAWGGGLMQEQLFPGADHFLTSCLRFGAYFAAGMVLRSHAHRIPASWGTVVLAGLAVWAVLATDTEKLLLHFPLGLALLGLGATAPLRLGRENDLSYGLYVYAFPVQQVLFVLAAHFGVVPRFGPFLAASLLLGLLCAAGSWFLVERPVNSWASWASRRS